MRLAIVGSHSRFLTDRQKFRARDIIDQLILDYKPEVIVSGGCSGIDQLAAEVAGEKGVQRLIFLPENWCWAPHGFKERNLKIAENCDMLVRIVSQDSTTYGSGWTRDRAKELGVTVEEFILASGER